MNKQNRYIPNPNRISEQEQKFITKNTSNIDLIGEEKTKEKYKGRMISMSDSFYKELNSYLKKNPTEGNRSSFIVRVVAEYIERKM